MQLLTREAILALKGKYKQQVVHVPEWGGDVIVRELTADEAQVYEAGLIQQRGVDGDPEVKLDGMRQKIVSLGCIKEDGSRLFTDEDTILLGSLGRAPLDRVATAISNLSGYGKEAEDKIKKNSQSAENSSSDSRLNSESRQESSASGLARAS